VFGQEAAPALLLDALSGVPISDAERGSLMWLAGFEAQTVENVAAVITRTRQTRRVTSSLDSPPHRGVPPRGRSPGHR
jgi:hypothetical protein